MASTPEGVRAGADAAPGPSGTAPAGLDGERRRLSAGARVALVLVSLLGGLPVLGIGAGAAFLAVQTARMDAYNDARAAQAQQTVLEHCARTYGFTPEITSREGRSKLNGVDQIGHIGIPRDRTVAFEAAHDGTAFQIEADYAPDGSDPFEVPEGPIDATIDRLRDNYQADEIISGVYTEVVAVLGLPAPASTNAATIKRTEMLTDVHYDGTNAREAFGATDAGALGTLELLYGADVDLDETRGRADGLLPEGTGGHPIEFWCDIYQLRAGADPAQWDWTRDPKDYYPITRSVLGISPPLSMPRRPGEWPGEQGVGTTYITDSQLAYWESTHFIALFAPVTPSELPGDLDWSETARLTGGTSHDPVGTVHRVSTSESERMSGQWVRPADDTVYIPASLIDDYLGQGYRDAAMLIFDPSVEVGTPYDVESPVRCGDYYVIDRPFHKGEYFTLALAR